MYTIYKNISVDEFITLKNRVTAISDACRELEQSHQYTLPNDEKSDVALALSYTKKADRYHYNIGFNFDDNIKKTFHTYLLKAYDTPNIRYYKSKVFYKDVDIDFLEKNWKTIFEKSIELINSWKKEDLKEEGLFTPHH